MTTTRMRYLALGLVLAGLVLLSLGSRKNITLQVDGKAKTITTSAFTVGGLIQAAGLSVSPHDRLIPARDHWLSNGDKVRIEHAAQVHILADDRSYDLVTTEKLPSNLLALAGVPLFPGDRIEVNGLPVSPGQPLAVAPSYSLTLRRMVKINLQAGPESRSFYSSAPTLGQALEQAGLDLRLADHLEPPPQTAITHPVTATLQRAIPLTVQLHDRKVEFLSAARTVGEALSEAGLSLQGLDYSQPSSDSPLPRDGHIRVVRVAERLQIEQEPLPFETEMQPAPDVELDTRKVIQAGEYGLTAKSVRIHYEDGQEASHKVESEWIARRPKKRILGYGTKVVVRTLKTPDGPIQYWRAVDMYATSYSPCRIYKDHCDSYTASGATLQKGIVAMTGAWYRYTGGDQVYVPGYGVGTVADTGGGIRGRYWIDLGYSEQDYVSWHQMVTVYFLTPVPDNIMWVLP